MAIYKELLLSSKLSTGPLSCTDPKSMTSQLFFEYPYLPLEGSSAMNTQAACRISASPRELVISAAVLAAATAAES